MMVAPRSRTSPMIVLTSSTCCSIDTGMFDSTDGLWGPVIVNRFGKPATVRPEVGAWSVRPLVAQELAVPPPDVDAGERAGHCVEAGRVDDRVEVVLRPVLPT